jgi:PIN domain nuclease of toxin-antitoxin system
MIALDASALLAYLFNEPGGETVANHLPDCCLSTINLAEVLGVFARDGHHPDLVRRRISSSPITLVPFCHQQATLAAALLPVTRPLGLSLGDRSCLALALHRDIPVLTADRTWSSLDVRIEIRQIR